MPETETIDRFYLELSQFTQAKTRRELELGSALEVMTKELLETKARMSAIILEQKERIEDMERRLLSNRETNSNEAGPESQAK